MKKAPLLFFMINKICIFIVLLSSFYSSKAQNLVPNWSFENYYLCPGSPSCMGIGCCKNWYTPTANTPDYYHACSPWYNVPGGVYGWFQYAKQGQAYAGVFLWELNYNTNKEYIQVKLSDTLVKDRWYCGGFWINKREDFKYAVRNAGMYVSKEQIGSSIVTYLEYTPQINYNSPQYLTDTANWVLVSGSFQAQGGERYITIGNFNHITDSLLWNPIYDYDIAYYFIDAVFLYDCSEHVQAFAGEDASICGEETAHLGNTPIDGCHYKWTPNIGLDNDTLANPTAKPTQTTTYCLTMTDPYYQITTDTVVVKVTDDCKQVFFIPNIFSPNSDGQNDVFRIRGENISNASLQIYNRWGNLVFESQDITQGWDGTFNGKDCEEGVYYFKAEIIFKDGKVENKKGNITLLR